VSTLAFKVTAENPPMFSDVILTTRLGKEFYWETENPQAEVKSATFNRSKNRRL